MGPNRYVNSGITDKTSFLPEIGIKRISMFVILISYHIIIDQSEIEDIKAYFDVSILCITKNCVYNA